MKCNVGIMPAKRKEARDVWLLSLVALPATHQYKFSFILIIQIVTGVREEGKIELIFYMYNNNE